jgi:RNA-directed DNA polymerase
MAPNRSTSSAPHQREDPDTRLQEGQYEITVPTIADRVVQASLKAVLEPIFEADFKPCSYGFRPNRRAHDAIAEIHYLGTRGYPWVLEADIKACLGAWSHCSFR